MLEGVISPLKLGNRAVSPPVVLAPMAGITNVAFRRLCREQGGGVYVNEMITTRALVERIPKTLKMIAFAEDESFRSLQLYGVDPQVVGAAVRMVGEDNLADHVDLNFGCPVPKVTRRGGGAALPWRRQLFARIVHEAVEAAKPYGIPLTVKMRKGIDDDHLTYVEAGLIAQEAGAAVVALHARTAEQRYSGEADWDAIATLKQALDVPVLGNGDIWEGSDALRMVEHTGVDGVVVGRGCLGRPWLFADLEAAFTQGADYKPVLPTLGEVAKMMARHAELLVDALEDERHGCADFRKHVAWYLKGFPIGGELRRRLAMISSLAELDDLLGKLDPAEPFPVETLGQPRGRVNAPGKVSLPYGWLESRDDVSVPSGAEMENSGG
ncbi:tRNA dihydrouridine synthase DusB [Actinoplanes sp. TBRC 11911]|uniref:tRNA dihydrouridine synthase DusB n=1 Tax=Actinoplanes sp. TBRC 11911 TaxID=2729386 RepID=UPI00145D303E|nr:tRNA dihydrouridine synthase DusB [Actinoplanes sp. TBRC 11911]NMO55928.1 tRNA dihydrouridine synthase DusB [Actinoplanes sp. TBRC 11911]